jgi:hypothetical protein
MKISSVFCISAIAASTLIAFSTSTLAISQPKNITTNLELQSLQISEHSTLKIAQVVEKGDEEDEEGSEDVDTGRRCPRGDTSCGWW